MVTCGHASSTPRSWSASPIIVVLAEDDPGWNARFAKSRGERAVAIEILEIAPGLSAQEARVVVLQLGNQGIAALRWQAALHRRTDHLQHRRVRQVAEPTAEPIERARELGLVLAREARREQDQRPGEFGRGNHLEPDVGAQTMANHDVAAEIGGEPARQRRVVLHAEVVRSRRTPESRQRGGHETDRCVAQLRLGQQVVVEDRAGERAGEQENCVIRARWPRLTHDPAEVLPACRAHGCPQDDKSQTSQLSGALTSGAERADRSKRRGPTESPLLRIQLIETRILLGSFPFPPARVPEGW